MGIKPLNVEKPHIYESPTAPLLAEVSARAPRIPSPENALRFIAEKAPKPANTPLELIKSDKLQELPAKTPGRIGLPGILGAGAAVVGALEGAYRLYESWQEQKENDAAAQEIWRLTQIGIRRVAQNVEQIFSELKELELLRRRSAVLQFKIQQFKLLPGYESEVLRLTQELETLQIQMHTAAKVYPLIGGGLTMVASAGNNPGGNGDDGVASEILGTLIDQEGRSIPVLRPDVNDEFILSYRRGEEAFLRDTIERLRDAKEPTTIVVFGPSGAGKTHAIEAVVNDNPNVSAAEYSPFIPYEAKPGLNILSVTAVSDDALAKILEGANIKANATIPFYAKPLSYTQIDQAVVEHLDLVEVSLEPSSRKLVFFRDPRGVITAQPLPSQDVIVEYSESLLYALLSVRHRHPEDHIGRNLSFPKYKTKNYDDAMDWYRQLGSVAHMDEAALIDLVHNALALKDAISVWGLHDPSLAVSATRFILIHAFYYSVSRNDPPDKLGWESVMSKARSLRNIERLKSDMGVRGHYFTVENADTINRGIAFMESKIDKSRLPHNVQPIFDFLLKDW